MEFILDEKITEDQKIALFTEYASRLSGITDDYWEMHILGAVLYAISDEGRNIGYFTIHNSEKLTSFYIEEAYLFAAQVIFQRILSEFAIRTAYVATCDELFLSLCLDFHQKVEMQAYFFETRICYPVKPPEYSRSCLSEIAPEELDDVNRQTDGFFADEEIIGRENMIYRLANNGITLGYGVLVPIKTRPELLGCGMVTLKEHRQKGVGRSIQLHLADICRENGKLPLSSCWYYNHLSKKTIESAGRYSKTRLLNVHFAVEA
jgi:GNAT superfamily N-acetyltransferase